MARQRNIQINVTTLEASVAMATGRGLILGIRRGGGRTGEREKERGGSEREKKERARALTCEPTRGGG